MALPPNPDSVIKHLVCLVYGYPVSSAPGPSLPDLLPKSNFINRHYLLSTHSGLCTVLSTLD